MSIEPAPAAATDEADVKEQVDDGPKIVVTAMALSASGREALAESLGPGHIVVDIRDANDGADIVLIPPASPQLVGKLRGRFPSAQLLITEFTDPSFGQTFAGPVTHSIDSGVDGYFVAPTMANLAELTAKAAHRPIRGELPSGWAGQADLPRAASQPSLGAAERREVIAVDIADWSSKTGLGPETLLPIAWPLLTQLAQQTRLLVSGLTSTIWRDRAREAGFIVA